MKSNKNLKIVSPRVWPFSSPFPHLLDRGAVKPHRVAMILLLSAALFWGAGNVANKTVLDHIGPLAALSLRAFVGAMVIAPFALRERRTAGRGEWVQSALGLSALFAIAITFQQLAFVSTSVTNASFLVNTCSVMTPVFAWVLLGQRPSLHIVVASLMTFLGVFMMSGGSLSLMHPNGGDLACIASAAFYACWMVALGQHAVRCRRPFGTCFLQFGFTSVVMLPISIGVEGLTLDGAVGAWREILFLGVFSTGAAFALQTHAQQFVAPSSAAVLVSSESLFGAIGAFLILGERTSSPGMAGGLLILLGIVLAAMGPQGLKTVQPDLAIPSTLVNRRSLNASVEFRSVRTQVQMAKSAA